MYLRVLIEEKRQNACLIRPNFGLKLEECEQLLQKAREINANVIGIRYEFSQLISELTEFQS